MVVGLKNPPADAETEEMRVFVFFSLSKSSVLQSRRHTGNFMKELQFQFLTIAFLNLSLIQLHMFYRPKPHLSLAMEEMGFTG